MAEPDTQGMLKAKFFFLEYFERYSTVLTLRNLCSYGSFGASFSFGIDSIAKWI